MNTAAEISATVYICKQIEFKGGLHFRCCAFVEKEQSNRRV